MPAPSYHPFVRALARGLRDKCGVAGEHAVLLAVSGGADSTALLRAAALLAPKRGWALRLGVAHVHHGMRREAEAEAQAVAALAKNLGLPFFRADLDPAAFKGRNLEEAMREARYGALAGIARDHGFPCVATAHHADDQLETLLLRLCRGCRPEALAGMAWRRKLTQDVALIRPLLGVEHADALDFLRALGQTWHEDASNTDEDRARAKLRLKVVPALKELHPDAAKKAVALAEAVAEENQRGGPPRGNSQRGEPPRPLSRAEARAMAPTDLRHRLKELLHAHGIPRVNAALLAQLAAVCADPSGKARTVDLAGERKLSITRHDIQVIP